MWVQYYDFLIDGEKEIYPLIGSILTIILIALSICGFKSRHKPVEAFGCPSAWLFFGSIAAVICFIVNLTYYYEQKENYESLKAILNQKKYLEVEGKVKILISIDSTRRKRTIKEIFKIKNASFSLNTGLGDIRYGILKRNSAMIDKSKYVRIQYYNNIILRLWVWEEKEK
jgi:Na+/melibiose symporter-like transporter